MSYYFMNKNNKLKNKLRNFYDNNPTKIIRLNIWIVAEKISLVNTIDNNVA